MPGVKKSLGKLEMKKILILYPHFPPSNLAGVHRPRLFAQHLPSFGWEPVILTVHEKYYEEKPDWNLVKLLPPGLRVEKVNAFNIGRVRLIGDIGLRAFLQLYKKARILIQKEEFDFLLIPVPSFYCALLGRLLHKRTGIKYGVDYIDPWVHYFPGSEKKFSRHWLSTQLARFLEPIAIKKASLITGVAEGYYQAVLKRNPHLIKTAIYGAMPYGGEEKDHLFVSSLDLKPYLFEKQDSILQIVYAGALLPKAHKPLEAIFKSIAANKKHFTDVKFHFIGTGSRTNDENSFNIKQLAERYSLYNSIIFEYPKRIPYLDVLIHLNISDGVFILGSTEPHYTPSKTYQAILSRKYILAVLHQNSTAVRVIQETGAGNVLCFDGEHDLLKIENQFLKTFLEWKNGRKTFSPENISGEVFNEYSAFNITKVLVNLLNKSIE